MQLPISKHLDFLICRLSIADHSGQQSGQHLLHFLCNINSFCYFSQRPVPVLTLKWSNYLPFSLFYAALHHFQIMLPHDQQTCTEGHGQTQNMLCEMMRHKKGMNLFHRCLVVTCVKVPQFKISLEKELGLTILLTHFDGGNGWRKQLSQPKHVYDVVFSDIQYECANHKLPLPKSE